jgi:type I restriction enzyme M protein
VLTPAIKSKIHSLWDKFWSGGIANPLTAIEQISYLLFMRRLDAQDQKRKDDAEYLGQKYRSIFWGKKECRWSHFRHLPADEMLVHVRDSAFPFIKGLGAKDQPFTQYMQDAVFIMRAPSTASTSTAPCCASAA